MAVLVCRMGSSAVSRSWLLLLLLLSVCLALDGRMCCLAAVCFSDGRDVFAGLN